MITKEQFIESLVKEIEIIKHLGEKVDKTKLDYRPTAGQRSTLELMKYIGQMITTAVTAYSAGDEVMYIDLLGKNQEGVTLENFAEKMNEQESFVKEKVGALTEEDMKRESTIFGSKRTLAMQLLGVLKSATAYKMQLFLYIKASGNPNIGTSNLWGGRDMPPKA